MPNFALTRMPSDMFEHSRYSELHHLGQASANRNNSAVGESYDTCMRASSNVYHPHIDRCHSPRAGLLRPGPRSKLGHRM